MIELQLDESSWEHSFHAGGETSVSVKGPVEIYLRGHVYCQEKSLRVDELHQHIPVFSENLTDLMAALASLAGFYCIIICTERRTIAVVDSVRSFPLFYLRHEDCTYISESAEAMRELARCKSFDPQSVTQFNHTGYVTGSRTLFKEICQLQAGELIIAENSSSGHPDCHRYWRFTHDEDSASIRSDNFDSLLEKSLAIAVSRCIDYAGGRQIVLPLSGGYDSRLLATEFSRQNCPNLLAISYGEEKSKELPVARRVADSLDIEWQLVLYSASDWEGAVTDDERLDYEKNASGWCSLPHFQDWLAVKRLKREGRVDPDCVFVPGHTGDFVSGGHLPEEIFRNSTVTLQELRNHIVKKHYKLLPGMNAECSSILSVLNEESLNSSNESISNAKAASLFEEWEWQERQAKYIVNSVRVYEHCGYDWWLPLWDREFVEFWKEVPLALRRGKRRYNEFVVNHYKVHGKSARQESHSASRTRIGKQLAILVRQFAPDSVMEKIRRERKVTQIRRGFLGYKGRLKGLDWKKMTRAGIPINGLNVWLFLNGAGNRYMPPDEKS